MNIEMSLARLLQRLHLQKESLFLFWHYQIIYEFILILQIINLQSNFSQNFPYAHVSIQAPGVLQMCPLTSLVKYFESTMTIATSMEVQSWEKGSFWRALDNFDRYLEPILETILVGCIILDSQKLNPDHN